MGGKIYNLIALFVVAFLIAITNVGAEVPLPQVAHYDDINSEATVANINQLLKPQVKRTFFYSSSTIWSQHQLPSSDGSGDYYLVLKNPLIRNVSAFIDGSELSPIRHFPFITYRLATQDSAKQVLLRLRSNTIIGTNLYLANKTEVDGHTSLAYTLILLYLGSILTLFILLLVYGIKEKSCVFLHYAAVLVTFHLAGILASVGFPFKVLTATQDNFSWSLLCLPNMGVITSILFIERITRSTKRMVLNLYRNFSLTLSALIVLISPFYHEHHITRLSMVAIYLGLIYCITKVIKHIKKNSDLKNYRLAFLAIASGFIIFTLQYAGIISHYEFRYAILLGAVVDVSIVIFMIYRVYEKRHQLTQYLTYSLAGMVPDEDLQVAASRQVDLNFNSSRQDISIVFIDIAQFSKIMDELDDEEKIMAPLKLFYSTVSQVIRDHGGITNKSIGDGLIGYFGYDIFGNASEDHATSAVECGMAIQRRICELINSQELTIPLVPRIGINSGNAIVGNTSDNRIDYNIIGKSVNLASRLEGACTHFKLLISKESADNVNLSRFRAHKKHVVIKHYQKPIEAYEIDPFDQQGDGKEVQQAVKLFREYNNIHRSSERRYHPTQEVYLKINVPIEKKVRLIDFSVSGSKLLLPIDLAKGTVLHCNYGDINFFSTVSWSTNAGGFYLVGIAHNYSPAPIKERLFDSLIEQTDQDSAA